MGRGAMLAFLSIAPWHVDRSVPALGRDLLGFSTIRPGPTGRPPKAVGEPPHLRHFVVPVGLSQNEAVSFSPGWSQPL